MRSLEVELGLTAAQSGSSYFDYVEEKLIQTADSRARILENQKLKAELARFAKEAEEASQS